MDSEVAVLRTRISELECLIAAVIRAQTHGQAELIRKWRLNSREATIVAALSDGQIHDVTEIIRIFSGRDRGSSDTARSFIHRIRAKIAPVEIRSIYGRGYRLDESHRAAVVAVMEGKP